MMSSIFTPRRLLRARRPALPAFAALPRLFLVLLFLLGCLQMAPATAQTIPDWRTEQWAGTWGAGPAGPPLDSATAVLNSQTLRLIVHTSVGGSRVRIRLSNEMGSTILRVGSAHIALRAGSAAAIAAGSDRTLTFSGATSVALAPGAAALSDPVALTVPALADLAVSLYLPGAARVSTLHAAATQISYISAPGNFVNATSFPTQSTTEQWPFLTEVDVSNGGAFIALGDSITDGLRSWGNYNYRWPDWLARRLQSAGGSNSRLGVVNRGIAGNNLLSNLQTGSLGGRSALERFDRDVLATAGARFLFVLSGTNDILNSTTSSPVSADELIAGYRQLIARAHARGIAVFAGTLPPFEGASYYTAAKELVRQAANNWIRASAEFDGVVDFDQLLRDPANPRRLNPSYDSADHLHPNNAGYQAMGNALPLSWFGGTSAAVTGMEQASQAVVGMEQ
ncbi:SGNH/GDSL hydrolase family protein [Massilia sp. DWR3-1-1]|uniref:SGNH/GDSL hydrolase family protein n=1 Tax=Massilia sp. DWR3-1-1 TaxID=2804559 RepID=UPI003CF91967